MAGQTLTEIRTLLAAAGLSPQHRFGQNFLVDLNLMRKLVSAAGVCAADVVLEIGPGTGSLTEMLLERGARVVAVEIDRGLCGVLRSRLGDHPRFTLVQADVLASKHEINPLVMQRLSERPPDDGGGRKLAANLPYGVATSVLMNLLYAEPALRSLTCTIQREVGERLSAAPRSDAYGPISIVAQSLAQIEPVAILPPSVFWPRPEVESIMLTLRPRARESLDISDIPGFVSLVRRGFQQRRKMLRQIFREWSEQDAAAIFGAAGVNAADRPEDLDPAAWRRLSRAAARLWA